MRSDKTDTSRIRFGVLAFSSVVAVLSVLVSDPGLRSNLRVAAQEGSVYVYLPIGARNLDFVDTAAFVQTSEPTMTLVAATPTPSTTVAPSATATTPTVSPIPSASPTAVVGPQPAGNPLLGSCEETQSHDVRADGEIDYVERYEYSAVGSATKYQYFDGAGSDSPLNTIIYSYDAMHRWELVERYGTDLSAPSAVETFLYGANQMIRSWSIDDGNDGSADFVKSFEYNAEDQLHREFVDSDGDGDTDKRTEFDYDSDGLLIESRRTSFPGAGTVIVRYRWIDRKLIEVERVADDVVVSITYYEYDSEGAMVEERQDTDADGDIDVTWRFESDGMEARSTMWVDDLLQMESIVWYGFRSLIERMRLHDIANGYLRDTAIVYECPGEFIR